ncbi:PD40 domain-containing protein [Candidatus Falkowbacteria bacterium]|nr:PD40 domain-containing protein [Candidatus Falkowbacteria bacterium]
MRQILFLLLLVLAIIIALQFFVAPKQSDAAIFSLANNSLMLINADNQQTIAANSAAQLYDQQSDFAIYAETIKNQFSASETASGGDLWLINKQATIHKQLVADTKIIDAIIALRTQTIFYLTTDAQLFSMNFDGLNTTAIANKVISPTISADERFLTYQKLDDSWQPNDYFENSRGIFIFDITTNKERQITNAAEDFAPFFSPKATKIIFNSLSPEGLASFFIVDSTGSNRKQLTNLGQKFVTNTTVPIPTERPSWSPNGKYLVFESDNEIWLLEFASDLNSITRSQRISFGKSPRWRADGKTISVLTNEHPQNIINLDVNGNLIK